MKLLFILFALILNLQNSIANISNDLDKYVPVSIYTEKDGLPSNNIQDIVQDEEGYLWLGTQEGLSRFDSSKFSNFTKDKSDNYSLPGILVEDLILMPDGQLWMSIYEVGITVFDKFTQQSKSIKNADSSLFQLPNSNLYGMAKDNSNNIWFSIYGAGIYQWNVLENKFYKHLASDENAWLTSTQTYEIMVDSKNRLWICTIDSKVYYYDIDSGNAKYFDFSSGPNDNLSSPIYGFAESSGGEVYAGGYSGVFKFDEDSEIFQEVISKSLINSYYNGERTSVRRLLVDSRDNLWIGTTQSLLLYANEKLSKVHFYEDGNMVEKLNITIHSIIEDLDGNIWLGTEGLGLIKVAADWNRYKIYVSQDKDPIDIRRAHQFQDKIWLIHNSSKMDLLSYTNDEIKYKSSFSPQLNGDYIRIESVYQDRPETMWISSVNGIDRINVLTGVSRSVVDVEGKSLGSVSFFHRAKDNKFYFNFFGKSEIGYFEEDEMIAHVIKNTDTNFFKGNQINQISEGLDGKLWLATDNGIESLDVANQKFETIFNAEKKLSVSSFYMADNKKDVWMIADGGLYQLLWDGTSLQLQNNQFQKILPLLNFEKIKRLKNNVLLITTEDRGLVEINIETLRHNVYNTENGLPSDVIQDVLFLDDMLFIITEAGVALQNKQFEDKEQKIPLLVFDRIELGEKKIKPDIEKLRLGYDFGMLSFDVALLSYANSALLEYEYKLEGLNGNWINTGSDDHHSFLNLDAGSYTFKVRGRSNYGKWSDVEEFSFSVSPPPWKTWWAYLLYAFAFFTVIYWLLYLYKRKILYEHEITKQQTQKHIANAASKAKSDFLARVSHEVRTPLNGVLGMGELMMDTPLDEEQVIYADSIMASGKHLLGIINDILDLSKIEAGKMELENQSFNLLSLIDEIVGAFTSQSKQKELLFTCQFDPLITIQRYGDVIRIKQILFNLLSNAFKFTKQGEIILIVVADKNDENRVVFTIKDSGIGLDEKSLDGLFKPFVQADSAITRKFGGTGLGLAIVKQLVEMMNGHIKASGEINSGSIFTVDLLLETSKVDLDSQAKSNSTTSSEICVLIKQKNIRKSFMSYLERMDVNVVESITQKTKCIFVDVISDLDELQISALENASEINVGIYLVGFNLNKVENKTIIKNKAIKLISPPITYKKIKNTCVGIGPQVQEKDETPDLIFQEKLSILVVEDNTINQQVSIEMLERMGHLVDIVDSAEEALNMLNQNRYNLLFVDYHLPGMDGLSLISVWDNKESVPIVVVTADLTDDLYQKCHSIGVDNIVAKPFTKLSLSDAIDRAFE